MFDSGNFYILTSALELYQVHIFYWTYVEKTIYVHKLIAV